MFLDWLRNTFRSKYLAHLEAERTRLLAENARLYDALLVKNGMAPLTPRVVQPQKLTSGRPLPSQAARRMSNDSLHHTPGEKPQ